MAKQEPNNAICADNFETSHWIGWEPDVDDIDWDSTHLTGSWRDALECTDQDSGEQYVLKVSKKKPLEDLFGLKPNRFFRWLIRCDENSGERRALIKLHKRRDLRHHFPTFISHGKVNGRTAIVVTKASVAGEVRSLKSHVMEHGLDERLRGQLEELCTSMCDRHIVCNDISANNITLSDQSGALVPMIIDGFGNNHLIPYPVFSKRLNARKLRRRFGRTIKRLDALAPKPGGCPGSGV